MNILIYQKTLENKKSFVVIIRDSLPLKRVVLVCATIPDTFFFFAFFFRKQVSSYNCFLHGKGHNYLVKVQHRKGNLG